MQITKILYSKRNEEHDKIDKLNKIQFDKKLPFNKTQQIKNEKNDHKSRYKFYNELSKIINKKI